MKLRNILLFFLFLNLSLAQANTNWVLVSGTGSANEYIDISTIQRSGNVVTAWILGDLADARPFKGRTFRLLKTQVEFDCAANRFRQIHASLYSGQMGAGIVLESASVSNPWESAVPQSVGQTKLRTVCQR